MRVLSILTLLLLCVITSGLFAAEEEAKTDDATYIQLIDKLDRPEDGYCLDVPGSGQYIRFDMPLSAHNCKGPQAYADETVTLREDGTLFFPRLNGCATVMGLNNTALPFNALMLKRCDSEEPFMNGPRFQKFALTKQGQLQLNDSDLCIMAGEDSHTTYSPQHKWRSLYMQRCEHAPLSYSAWQVVKAGY